MPVHCPPTGRRRQVVALGVAATAALCWFAAPSRSDAAIAPNLLRNPTFNVNLAGWQPGGGQFLTRVAGRSGMAARVRVLHTSTAVLADSPNSVHSTKAGQVYTASAWVRTDRPRQSGAVRLREVSGGALVAQGQNRSC